MDKLNSFVVPTGSNGDKERLIFLYNKENLTPKEESERTKLHRLRTNTAYTVKLLEDVDKGNPDTVFVSMGSGNIIESYEGSNKSINIFTNGLSGCTGTVIYIGLKDGTKKVILTHFPPTSILENINLIKSLTDSINFKDIVYSNTLYLSPDIKGNDKDINDTFLNGLQIQLKSIFGPKYNGKVKKYSLSLLFGIKDSGVLSVNINEERVSYKNGQYDSGILDGIIKEEEKEVEKILESIQNY